MKKFLNLQENIYQVLAEFGFSKSLASKLFTLLFFLIILYFLRRVLKKGILSRIKDTRQRYQWQKNINYFSLFFLFLIVFRTFTNGFEGFATFLGLTSAGLAVALKDPLVNLVGWLFFMVKRTFDLEDRIEVNGVIGDVIDVGFFEFSLLEVEHWDSGGQSTGRIIHVPNGIIFQNNLINFNQGFSFIWGELDVVCTFESNWRKAKELLFKLVNEKTAEYKAEAERSLRRRNGRYLINYNNLTPTVYTTVQDSGICLTLRFLCKPKGKRIIEEKLWEGILDIFLSHPELDFAYPTRRIFSNTREGKIKNPYIGQVKNIIPEKLEEEYSVGTDDG